MNRLLAAIVAASLAIASPLAAQTTFLQGETLDYNLTWLKITGGTARMTVAPVPDDSSRVRITSVAKSSSGFSRIFKVHDQLESIIARDDFSTLMYMKRLDEGGDQISEVTTIADGIATRVRKKAKTLPVPRPVYDPISVIYYLRTLDLTVGKQHELKLVADGKLYEVHARVTRKEKIQTPAGTFNTVLVEPRWFSGGVEKKEKTFLWFSDDARRLPVRIRSEVNFGAITATLRGTANTVTSTDPPVLRTK